MSTFALIGSLIGICTYVPLCIQIVRRKIHQNFATWAMWAVLDSIAAASIIYQHGNSLLPSAYALGSTATALCIMYFGDRKWTWFETMIASLALACMIVWATSGAYVATIASTTAVCIATVPLMRDCYREPHKAPLGTYASFLIANIFGTIGGKEWSVIERLYPAACVVLCAIIVGLSARKYLPAKKSDAANGLVV